MRLESGNVVTSRIDPFAAYSWAFGIRQTFDLPAARAAFRHAGREYVHVRCSPSSKPELAQDLAQLGFTLGWTEGVPALEWDGHRRARPDRPEVG